MNTPSIEIMEDDMTDTTCQKSQRAHKGMINRPCGICGTGPCRDSLPIEPVVNQRMTTGDAEVLGVGAYPPGKAQEQALGAAVVEAAMESYEQEQHALKARRGAGPTQEDWKRTRDKRNAACEALRTHMAPPEPEPAKPRCEPPEDARGERWHWLMWEGAPIAAEWKPNYRYPDGDFWIVAQQQFSKPRATELGYTYHSVAKPSPMVEPTDEEIIGLAMYSLAVRSMEYYTGDTLSFTRDKLITFSRSLIAKAKGEV